MVDKRQGATRLPVASHPIFFRKITTKARGHEESVLAVFRIGSYGKLPLKAKSAIIIIALYCMTVVKGNWPFGAHILLPT